MVLRQRLALSHFILTALTFVRSVIAIGVIVADVGVRYALTAIETGELMILTGETHRH